MNTSPIRNLLVLLSLLLPCRAFAQPTYTAPLRGALLVTGTFGELRSDHYHAGLDFRAATGTPVYAVSDGFVSSIVVSPGGYGQAIYVDHPDGMRSVYAHLETLAPELTDTLRAIQFAGEQFAQRLEFDSLAFPVTRGQRIGGVGNRGHSFGSHLHFEMREIAGDVPVNPLRFGFKIPDRRAPQIRSVRVYELNGDGHELAATNYRQQELGDTIFVRTPDVGIGVKAFDRQDAMPNWNGIYRAELYVDSIRRSGILHDRIPFELTEYLNANTDYRAWREDRSWFHLLFARTQVQHLGGGAMNGGRWLTLEPGRPVNARVDVADFAENRSQQAFVLVYRPDRPPADDRPHQYFLPAGEESLIQRPDLELHLPEGALYEDLYLQFSHLPDASADRVSATYHLHDPLTPLHGRATLRIRPDRPVPDSLRGHVYLGQCGDSGEHNSRGGRWTEDGWMEGRIGSFGDYALFLDTIPPTVRINNFPTNLSRRNNFSVLITDDVAGGGLSYRGTIDGKWVLLEYDVKNDKLTCPLADNGVARGKHVFELRVTDARGNATTWKRNFTY